MTARQIFIASVAVIAIITGAWLSWRASQPPPAPLAATILPQPVALPEFSLLDDRSRPFDGSGFAGQWDLVFFGFTNCPDICPLTLKALADARREAFGSDADGAPRIVLVSVDPERDRPENLGAYVRHFGDNTLGITGDLDEVQKFTKALGVWFEKSDVDGDAYSVDHSSVILVFNPAGEFHALFSGQPDVDTLAHDIPIIMSTHR